MSAVSVGLKSNYFSVALAVGNRCAVLAEVVNSQESKVHRDGFSSPKSCISTVFEPFFIRIRKTMF